MKALDFNAIERPTWPITLRDPEQTVVRLSTPSVELVDRLMAMAPDLEKVTKTKDARTVRVVYQLFTDIINCNEDAFTVTPEELRDTYRLTLYDLAVLTAGYLDFIAEINSAKN